MRFQSALHPTDMRRTTWTFEPFIGRSQIVVLPSALPIAMGTTSARHRHDRLWRVAAVWLACEVMHGMASEPICRWSLTHCSAYVQFTHVYGICDDVAAAVNLQIRWDGGHSAFGRKIQSYDFKTLYI